MKHLFEDIMIATGAAALGSAIITGACRMGWQGAVITIGGAAAVAMMWSAKAMKADARRERAETNESRVDKSKLTLQVLKDEGGNCLVSINAKRGDVGPELSAAITSMILSAEEATGDPKLAKCVLGTVCRLMFKDRGKLGEMVRPVER